MKIGREAMTRSELHDVGSCDLHLLRRLLKALGSSLGVTDGRLSLLLDGSDVAGHLVSRRLVQIPDHGHSRIVGCSDV